MTGFTSGVVSNLAVERRRHKALAILNFEKGVLINTDMVKARYNGMVKASHPDTGGVTSSGPTLSDMRAAKDFLIGYINDEQAMKEKSDD